MALSARAGRQEKHDALVEITGLQGPGESEDRADRRADPVTVIIESPVRDLFGADQDRTVSEILAELDVSAGDVHVYDRHALDFVLRARVRAAVERLRGKGGRI